MASTGMRVAFACLLLAMLVLAEANQSKVIAADPSWTDVKAAAVQKNKGNRILPQSCSPLCDYRCSNTQYRKPCIKYCNLCCQKCLCVPPGLYGNKQVCPCYQNMKNARGGPKCP